MRSIRVWFVIWIVLHVTPWQHVYASGNCTHYLLNSVIYNDAFKILHKPHTGRLYSVSVRYSSFSFRLRARSLWSNGVNFSSFEIPARLLPWLFTKRVDIVYQNIGNWSSYFSVANYTVVAPVLGLLAYDDSNTSSTNRLLELNITYDNPIIVRFSNISFLGDAAKCAWFGTNGVVELSNVTAKSSCVARGFGHFAIVVPYEPINAKSRGKRSIWWVVEIALGSVGLVLFIVMYKLIIRETVKKMETESERSEVKCLQV